MLHLLDESLIFYSVITDLGTWTTTMASQTLKIGRVMHEGICYGTCFAVRDLDHRYKNTKIIMTARHCVYSERTCTIPINYGLQFTFGEKTFGNKNPGSTTVRHVGTAKKFDVSAFRIEDPHNHIQTFQFGTSTPIFQRQQIYFGGYPDATDGENLHRDQPKFCFGRISSLHTDDYRVTCTINSCLPNHSGSPVVSLLDERGESFIGMHIEILSHSDDSNKVDDGAHSEKVEDELVGGLGDKLWDGSEEGVKDGSWGSGDGVEDEGGLRFVLEAIDVVSNSECATADVYESPNLDRLKRRAHYCEDNVAHKTSMSIFVQASALSLFYYEALGIQKTNNISKRSNNSKKRPLRAF